MKAGSAKLKALLATGRYYMADLYTITLQNGSVSRWTSFDTALIYKEQEYLPFTSERRGTTESTGLSVDDLEVTLYFDGTSGRKILYMMYNGEFDNATCALDVVFMPMKNPTDTSAGAVRKFFGSVDFESIDGTSVSMKVHHFTQKLNMTLPRNLYMPTCKNILFDPMCMLVKEGFGRSGVVGDGSYKSLIIPNTSGDAISNIAGLASFYSGDSSSFPAGYPGAGGANGCEIRNVAVLTDGDKNPVAYSDTSRRGIDFVKWSWPATSGGNFHVKFPAKMRIYKVGVWSNDNVDIFNKDGTYLGSITAGVITLTTPIITDTIIMASTIPKSNQTVCEVEVWGKTLTEATVTNTISNIAGSGIVTLIDQWGNTITNTSPQIHSCQTPLSALGDLNSRFVDRGNIGVYSKGYNTAHEDRKIRFTFPVARIITGVSIIAYDPGKLGWGTATWVVETGDGTRVATKSSSDREIKDISGNAVGGIYAFDINFATPITTKSIQFYVENGFGTYCRVINNTHDGTYQDVFNIDILAQETNAPDLTHGTITFMAGENKGVTRTIQSVAGGALALTQDLPYQPKAGDAYIAYPGCTRTYDMCANVYYNTARFRGYPYIPTSEALI